jgi:hypothetical protein
MRSVFVHLVGAKREDVALRLSEFAEDVGGDEWRFPRGSASPILYIGYYDDMELEWEKKDLDVLRSSLGQLPDLIVAADISGRVPGDAEVREFVSFMLRHFRGVATDDYSSPYPWTLAEIESGARVSGLTFFDYKGYRFEPESGPG